MKQNELTEKPIAFIGDIHGHFDFVKEIPQLLPDCHWVFLGDYVDSFTQSVPSQIATVIEVLIWIKEGRATALLGNHELSYFYDRYRASGYNAATASHLIAFKTQMQQYMKPFLLIDDVLVTHAGLSDQMYMKVQNMHEGSLEEALTELAEYPESPLYAIGTSRGGFSRESGIFWCDWNREFTPVEEYHQVFGHSNVLSVPMNFKQHLDGTLRYCDHRGKRSWNVDSLARDGYYDILVYDNGTFSRKRFTTEDFQGDLR